MVNAAIDYGMQVTMNYVQGYKGKDAWVNKVDFFDVAVSGGIGLLTGGAGTAYKAGEKVGKVGMFVLKHPELVKLGEIAVTSGIDITGEGWQPVEFDDFSKRVFIGAGTYLGTKVLGEAFSKKNPSPSYSNQKAIGPARDNLLNSVENPKLKSAINELYRPTASIGSGSTADALLYEKSTGILLSKTGHATKALGYRTFLLKLLNSGNLSDFDRDITIKILKDLQNALSK